MAEIGSKMKKSAVVFHLRNPRWYTSCQMIDLWYTASEVRVREAGTHPARVDVDAAMLDEHMQNSGASFLSRRQSRAAHCSGEKLGSRSSARRGDSHATFHSFGCVCR